MGFSRHHLESQRFVISYVTGVVDDHALGDHVRQLNELTQNMPHLMEVADCRTVTAVDGLSVNGAVLAAELEVHRPESRFAIVLSPGNELHYGLARAYQTFAEPKRGKVELLTDLDEALVWLFAGCVGLDEARQFAADICG
jgi:hypothetical protein